AGDERKPQIWPATPRSRPPVVAFVGGGAPHKGAALFHDVVAACARAGIAPIRWQVFGGGGPSQLLAISRLPGVRVRGYYRHGSLVRGLRRQRVQLTLLLSRFPESYSLVISESFVAGVPVMALGQGAMAPRLRRS